MKIYTGFGDEGKTRLYGGDIVDKDSLRVQAYGTVDELNSVVGLLITYTDKKELIDELYAIQDNLFELSSQLASPQENHSNQLPSPITDDTINEIEMKIDEMDKRLKPLKNFILPGGVRGAAISHLARTICRRAEREIITLHQTEAVNQQILVYINRLSDYFFVLSRIINLENNHSDILWKKNK